MFVYKNFLVENPSVHTRWGSSFLCYVCIHLIHPKCMLDDGNLRKSWCLGAAWLSHTMFSIVLCNIFFILYLIHPLLKCFTISLITLTCIFKVTLYWIKWIMLRDAHQNLKSAEMFKINDTSLLPVDLSLHPDFLGENSRRDLKIALLLSVTELDELRITMKNSTSASLSTNHDPVAQNNPQTWLCVSAYWQEARAHDNKGWKH